MDLTLGVALGDVTGIGPEVALKALDQASAADGCRYVLLGDRGQVRAWSERLGLKWEAQDYIGPTSRGRFFLHEPAEALPAGMAAGDPRAAKAAVAWLRAGAELCRRGELDALVTAPVNKAAIVRAGERFVGQTEFLSELAGTRRTAMMLLGEDDRGRALRVVLATTHLPLRGVADALSREGIQLAIELAAAACADLGLPRARVAVCGLNPHAGESGLLGTEEESVIAPAVVGARSRGIEVTGPVAADTLFHQVLRGDYEVVVAMYHDQGLAPLKMIAFENGVNWTLGLPFIRTSPDHGTAYDLANRGVANPSSMRAALELAVRLARRKQGSRR
ncbi:MAG: 4-hydroxythreonine-4-phosphate dehydrogenase PdxA [Verrucomicrobia bacterium]|nr:4-hydroxythreonine-4-phosphate dehydrogenase PdxA [Verrucomicrobiota bacterium]